MRRVFAIAALATLCIVALLLHNEIKDFLFVHPWWQSLIAAIPVIALPILAFFEFRHSGKANELRREANDLRARANTLQEEQNKSVATIGELQAENNELAKALDAERNAHLQQIAANTQRPLTEAEVNARILKKYLGRQAAVSEGHGVWGGGAVVAEVNDNNILTLFVPASHYNSSAYSQLVRCDKLHVVEMAKDGCPVQVMIMERYGAHTPHGEARTWDERNIQPANAGIKRGQNVFHAQYRKGGDLRHINVYAYADDSPNYIMAATEGLQETTSWHGGKLDIEKKFAIVQLERADQGYHAKAHRE